MDYVRTKIGDCEKVNEIYQCIFKSLEWLMFDKDVVTEEAINAICERNPDLSRPIKPYFLFLREDYEKRVA